MHASIQLHLDDPAGACSEMLSHKPGWSIRTIRLDFNDYLPLVYRQVASNTLINSKRSLCVQMYGVGVWVSLALMCASALSGSILDLAFDLEGHL